MLDLVNKALVKSILERAMERDWSLQGFGMLRTYLAPDLRLHVWDSSYQAKDVSTMHTHPWDFTSIVIAGKVTNTRYIVSDDLEVGVPYIQQQILCGEFGGESGPPQHVGLTAEMPEIYEAGDLYVQVAEEIHSSSPEDGTVTIIARRFLDDPDHAFVYYKEDDGWVTAEPRAATNSEIADICHNALERWF